MSRRRSERGVASLEVVGLMPVVAAVCVALMQGAAAVYSMQAATEAARQAARAASLDQEPAAAARAALPGGVGLAGLTTFGPGHGVRVTVTVPRLLPLGPDSVTRSAVMP